jgi:DNA-binding XRE family transcriptional regulator
MVYFNMKQSELIQWRKKHSLTQTELGNLLRVTKTCVYRWEAGVRNIPPFLHLALERLEAKGGLKTRTKRKIKKKGE